MPKWFLWLPRYVWANLGRCPLCTRKAFVAAAAAWGAVLLSATFDAHSIACDIATFLAIGLSVLWAAHIAAFATKLVGQDRQRDTFNPSRRAVFSIFVRTAITAAAASAAPGLAFAQGCPPPPQCGHGYVSCVRQYQNGTYSCPYCVWRSCYQAGTPMPYSSETKAKGKGTP